MSANQSNCGEFAIFNSLEFEGIKGGAGCIGGTSLCNLQKNPGNAAVPPAPTFWRRLGR